MNTEAIRRKYRPKQVRLLFVGESPPASGKFFYVGSAMTKYTARAFEKAHSLAFASTKDFLEHFKQCGCFLEDLCHVPVNHLPKTERESFLKKGIPYLSKRIKEINPPVVLIVLRKIEHCVRDAIRRSGCNTEIHVLPFAGMGHQKKYVEGLTEILVNRVQKLRSQSVVKTTP